MCESGCRPVVSTSSTRPDTVVRLGTGGEAATQTTTPSQVPAVPLGNTECPRPVPCQHTPGLSAAFCFTEKYCGKYQYMCACQPSVSAALCPSVQHPSPSYHLSSVIIYCYLSLIAYHLSLIHYLLSIYPPIQCLFIISSLSFIICRLSTGY